MGEKSTIQDRMIYELSRIDQVIHDPPLIRNLSDVIASAGRGDLEVISFSNDWKLKQGIGRVYKLTNSVIGYLHFHL